MTRKLPPAALRQLALPKPDLRRNQWPSLLRSPACVFYGAFTAQFPRSSHPLIICAHPASVYSGATSVSKFIWRLANLLERACALVACRGRRSRRSSTPLIVD